METTVALFGITGRTGRAVLAAAMARGWSVRGLVRDGSAAPDAERLTVVRGSLDDRDAIGDTLAGADAAVIVFGPRSGRDTFCASATDAIVATMQASGCRRLVCQTGAMLGDSVGNRSLAMNTMARLYEWMQPSMARDRRDQEAAVMASGLDWTIVKPPRLTDGPPQRSLQADSKISMGMMHSVSRADLAAFLLDEIATPRFLNQRVFVRT